MARAAADQAVASLTKAVAAGFSNVKPFNDEKAFDVLRERDDFKEIVRDLETKP